MRKYLIITVFALYSAIAIAGRQKKDAFDASLLGYWEFDTGQGNVALDSAPARRNGVVKNLSHGAKWVDGVKGKALYLFTPSDKADYHKCGCVVIPEFKYDFSKGFTIECWLKLNEKKQDWARFHEILTNTLRDRGPGFRWLFFYGSAQLRSGDGVNTSPGASSNQSKVHIPNNSWFHLALTFDGENSIIYLDGQVIAKSSALRTLSITSGDGKLSVGAYRYGYAYSLDGAIDELKIYSRPLSETEIILSYNAIKEAL